MKSMLKNYSLGALACIVLGVALVIRPHIITDVLNTALGVILIAWAIFGIMSYIFSRVRGGEERSIFSLFSEVILLIAGIVVLSNKSLLETAVMIALGLYLMCSGFTKLGTSLSVKRAGADGWQLPMITAVVTLALGIFVLISPTVIAGGFMRVIGVILALAGAVSFVSGFSASRAYSHLEELEKDIRYKSGRGRDDRDTHAEDKANAIDIDVDD